MAKMKVAAIVVGAASVLAGLGVLCVDRPANAEVSRQMADAATQPSGTDVAADITVLWAGGKKAEVMGQFRGIRWDSYHPKEKLSVFNVTEAEYALLTAADQQVINTRVGILREIMRYALDEGDACASRGEADQARGYYRALRDFGSHFRSDERALAVMKLVGKAVETRAKQKLKE